MAKTTATTLTGKIGDNVGFTKTDGRIRQLTKTEVKQRERNLAALQQSGARF